MNDISCSSLFEDNPAQRARARLIDDIRGLSYLYKELGEAAEAKAMADRLRDFLVGDLIEREKEAKRKEIADVTGPATGSKKGGAL